MKTLSLIFSSILICSIICITPANASKGLLFDASTLKTASNEKLEVNQKTAASFLQSSAKISSASSRMASLVNSDASSSPYVFFSNDISFDTIYGLSDSNIVGSLDLTGTLTASTKVEGSKLTATSVTADTLIVEQLISNGNFQINGNVVLTGSGLGDTTTTDTTTDSATTSFILKSKRSWKMHSHDDFEDHEHGWSFLQRQNCTKGYPNNFLGGHCALAATEVTKKFKDLPAHTEVRITAHYHAFDNWQGEYGYMKVDNKKVWERLIQAKPSSRPSRCRDVDFSDDLMNL